MKEQISVRDFCLGYDACTAGSSWALGHCETMQDVWRTARPDWLVWVATRRRVLSAKELRLFAVSCAQEVAHMVNEAVARRALSAAEAYANGEISWEGLCVCRTELDAILQAKKSTPYCEFRSALWAIQATALASARVAAIDAASDSTDARICEKSGRERVELRRAIEARQAAWLRENTVPSFDADSFKEHIPL